MALSSLVDACIPDTFSPTLFGAEVLSVEASLVTDYNLDLDGQLRFTAPSVKIENARFCNVTVTYTHPGYDDEIHAEAWLPVDNWNGRFQAVGGGGFAAGRFFLSYTVLAGAIYDGYAGITTDAGVSTEQEPASWALRSPGNVDWNKLQTFASTALNDQAVIGKSLVESFYGKPPSYSYWNGCSQGGRQGLQLAQRYPTAFDGIVVGAPAISWTAGILNTFWPEQVMRMLGNYPHWCELDAITAAVISRCDALDGVVDGIVADLDGCKENFDPFDLVGTVIPCADATRPISREAATVAAAAWEGIVSATGEHLWPGVSMGTDLTCNAPMSAGQLCLATTNCTGTEGSCVMDGHANIFGSAWIALFLAKDPDFDLNHISLEEFSRLFHASRQQYGSIIDTDDPDLSEFKNAGGKLIAFHGLADNLLPPGGTERYYREVSKRVDGVEDFFRYYPIPGLGHCLGGPGQPTSLFEQIRAWVENGTAPESSPVSFSDSEGVTQNRIICPWPQKAQFSSSCGDSSKADCWSCVAVPASRGKGWKGGKVVGKEESAGPGTDDGYRTTHTPHAPTPGIRHEEL